jgi:hypothetical protein
MFEKNTTIDSTTLMDLTNPVRFTIRAKCLTTFHLSDWKYRTSTVAIKPSEDIPQLDAILKAAVDILKPTEVDDALTLKVINKAFKKIKNEYFNATFVCNGVYVRNNTLKLRLQLIEWE